MEEYQYIILGLIILLSHTTEAMCGFGNIIISLTLGAFILPIQSLLPILVPLSLVLSTYIVIKYFRFINYSLLLNRIIPIMSIGMVLGYFLTYYISGDIVKKFFGLLIIIYSVRELYNLKFGINKTQGNMSTIKSISWMFFGGITHGIYASGGPLLVYSISENKLEKMVFRVTLSSVWLILNIGLSLIFYQSGKITGNSLILLLQFLPAVPIGIIMGEFIHKKISEYKFKIVIFCILTISGISFII